MTAAAKAVADLTQGVILARVDIAVPPERVFRALTTEELTKWWGADGMYRTTKFTFEPRAGGSWRAEGVGADGSPFHVGGKVIEIDPPHRIVQTWEPSWDPGPPTTITYALEAIATGTRVTVRHTGFTPDRAQSCDGHAAGWERVLEWLAGYVAPPAPRKAYMVRLIAPRPTFMADMTADEKATMLAHVMYMRKKLAEGIAIAFGPVADPAGGFGLGILSVADDAELAAVQRDDPATTIGLRYEVLPMVNLVH